MQRGSLGAAIGMMTWMWISMIVVVLGAELNADIQRKANSAASGLGRSGFGPRERAP
jgi:uncharacterized BrkB/YihY/UPF0761 family membrane protein